MAGCDLALGRLMAIAVSVREVLATSGGFPVLAGANLEVAAGEAVVLRGPNGAGKTSLLRLCAGLLSPVRGSCEVLGVDVGDRRRFPHRRIGMLAHDNHLYGDLSLGANIAFSIRASGRRGALPRAVAESLGLSQELLSVPARRCSAGQRRRAGLAMLLVRDPDLWLLDEPYASLDSSARATLDGILQDQLRRGATLVVASHDDGVEARLGARTISMAGGRVLDQVELDKSHAARFDILEAGNGTLG